jgi:hypothetical protein
MSLPVGQVFTGYKILGVLGADKAASKAALVADDYRANTLNRSSIKR